ncbi:hypothetical protein NMG60_11023254 [Bertholletia excelsa]
MQKEGVKWEWPELVGEPQKKAIAVIEKENPYVTVVPVPRDRLVIHDYCCNRVWLFVNVLGGVVVSPPPKVG